MYLKHHQPLHCLCYFVTFVLTKHVIYCLTLKTMGVQVLSLLGT